MRQRFTPPASVKGLNAQGLQMPLISRHLMQIKPPVALSCNLAANAKFRSP
jgi:hypothetical protein